MAGINMTGKRYGRLVVEYELPERCKNGDINWQAKCDCGKTLPVRGYSLRSGNTTSCGCYGKERSSETHTTHGMSKSTEFYSWDNMIQRCTNPNKNQYNDYGGRGITVYPQWVGKGGFAVFIKDMGKKPFPEATIDRIDNNGNYEPSNCKWASRVDQSRNSRNCKIRDMNHANQIRQQFKQGASKSQLAQQHGVVYETIRQLIAFETWS
jgi:hypothetical protein